MQFLLKFSISVLVGNASSHFVVLFFQPMTWVRLFHRFHFAVLIVIIRSFFHLSFILRPDNAVVSTFSLLLFFIPPTQNLSLSHCALMHTWADQIHNNCMFKSLVGWMVLLCMPIVPFRWKTKLLVDPHYMHTHNAPQLRFSFVFFAQWSLLLYALFVPHIFIVSSVCVCSIVNNMKFNIFNDMYVCWKCHTAINVKLTENFLLMRSCFFLKLHYHIFL